jgi:hypothetical protein
MKRVLAVFMVAALAAVGGLAYARSVDLTKRAGDLTVSVTMSKTPSVGENELEIGLKDAQGRPVTNALVKIDYSMPAMPGMPAMTYRTQAAPAGSTYRGTVNFPMAGCWSVNIRIARGDKPVSARLTIDVA